MTCRLLLMALLYAASYGTCFSDELPLRTLRVNGYDMSYVEHGSGTPVIFVHGSGVDYRYFAAQMGPFAAKYRAIAVSLRRFYPEHWNGKGEFSTTQHVADLTAFIEQLHAGPVHLVGHSRGGAVALYLARAHPELVRTLSLAEGGSNMPAFAPPPSAEIPDRQAIFRSLIEHFDRGDIDGGIAVFIGYSSGPGSWEKAPEPVKDMLRSNAWTFVGIAHDQLEPFTCEDADKISMPILLLNGDLSPSHQVRMVDNMQACMKGAERKVIQHSSHGMPRSNPAGFNEAVLEFISKHS